MNTFSRIAALNALPALVVVSVVVVVRVPNGAP